MKQMLIVFKFELFGYLKRKSYKAVIIVGLLILAVVLSWPRITSMIGGGKPEKNDDKEITKIAFLSEANDEAVADKSVEYYNKTMAEYGFEFEKFNGTEAEMEASVKNGTLTDGGIVMQSPLSYKRFVENLSMYDNFGAKFEEALLNEFKAKEFEAFGMSETDVQKVLSTEVTSQVVAVNDQGKNFMFSYVMLMVLFMAINMYGNFVASSVATEKSTRAMELLITSTKPSNLMFGKVFGAGLAGLLQMGILLAGAAVFYNLNSSYQASNAVISAVFDVPISSVVFAVVFFILGFFMYAFMFAAVASLVSRMEDLSTAILPVIYLFMASFMIAMFSSAYGSVDNVLMKVASFVPFTSPMVMMTRVSMGGVRPWEVVVSIAILVVSVVAIGILASNIYRIGVVLYGKRPNPKEIIAMLKSEKNMNKQ